VSPRRPLCNALDLINSGPEYVVKRDMLFLNNIMEPGGYHLVVEGDAVLGDVLSGRNEYDPVVFNNPQLLLQHQHLDDLQVLTSPS